MCLFQILHMFSCYFFFSCFAWFSMRNSDSVCACHIGSGFFVLSLALLPIVAPTEKCWKYARERVISPSIPFLLVFFLYRNEENIFSFVARLDLCRRFYFSSVHQRNLFFFFCSSFEIDLISNDIRTISLNKWCYRHRITNENTSINLNWYG